MSMKKKRKISFNMGNQNKCLTQNRPHAYSCGLKLSRAVY